jgi:hypothetical protein
MPRVPTSSIQPLEADHRATAPARQGRRHRATLRCGLAENCYRPSEPSDLATNRPSSNAMKIMGKLPGFGRFGRFGRSKRTLRFGAEDFTCGKLSDADLGCLASWLRGGGPCADAAPAAPLASALPSASKAMRKKEKTTLCGLRTRADGKCTNTFFSRSRPHPGRVPGFSAPWRGICLVPEFSSLGSGRPRSAAARPPRSGGSGSARSG